MTELARADTMADLVAALVARKNALNISDSEVDYQAGLTAGHWSKIAGGERGLGAQTLGPLLDAFGISLVLVEAPAKMRNLARLERRDERHVRSNHKVGKHALRRVMQELGRKGMAATVARVAGGQQAKLSAIGGNARAFALTTEQRKAIARMGWEAMQAKRKAKAAVRAKRKAARSEAA